MSMAVGLRRVASAESRAHAAKGAERALTQRSGGQLHVRRLAPGPPASGAAGPARAPRRGPPTGALPRTRRRPCSGATLRHQRPAAVGEPLDHPDLPQRLRAVERWDRPAPTRLRSSSSPPGAGRRRAPQVVAEVEVRVVDPHRAPEVVRNEPDALAVARQQRQLALQHRDDLVERRRRAVEDARGPDVHRRGRRFSYKKAASAVLIVCMLSLDSGIGARAVPK